MGETAADFVRWDIDLAGGADMCAVFLTLWSAADFVRWDIDWWEGTVDDWR